MNFGEIKAFMGDKTQVNPNDAVKNQLREAGLRQAEAGISAPAESTVSKLSSQTTVGLRIYNNSLNQTLQIDEKRANLKNPEETNKSLFDFEEVAKNVLQFVGGVISGAARNGADEETLVSLFEQARSGVSKGIKLAEKDLSGFMNEEISDGIGRSADLIEQGIQRLQDKLFGSQSDPEDRELQSDTSLITESLSASSQQNGELQIRTRDGDEVVIRFEDLKQFELNRQVLLQQEKQIKQEPNIEHNDVLPRAGIDSAGNETVETANNEAEEVSAQSNTQSETSQAATKQTEVQQSVFIAQNNYSFSVSGELDESELQSIGQLVSDANDLATTFFDGDIERAFEQALEIGFDEQELTSFALQLTRQEQVEVVKTYESVSHYSDEQGSQEQSSKPVERVSDYLQKMLNVFEQSQQKLADGDQYETLINSIINEVQDLGTNDLVSAINDFHAFNKQLLNNLPTANQSSESEQ
ncbi:DUF5610 domain-containing protein [Aliiglaciecola sp. 2_MG-2023]|uniref:DUF5610 domain-containing protein n=1 Tax=unclassified Aliiglaciecola TaxID=2593648 RepID=UPI0026E37755|nr:MULTISPECIES: DUF5610 domain-containing protein [unclassified Aliiglaciecola]MDO6709561.1 DUF5610 domain-containing protein [Aliiglaciecola sp. 2_MG-2023]MDO6750897.1 DUF5610 domain-containing protein [Aliiglaciecola sp. 1_MG-2023]